jgi:hypothetical protein
VEQEQEKQEPQEREPPPQRVCRRTAERLGGSTLDAGGDEAMLSKEDQRRFDEITRRLRESDPQFFHRLDQRTRARLRRGRYLMLLTVALWAALPAVTVLAGRPVGGIFALVLLASAALMWRYRHRLC